MNDGLADVDRRVVGTKQVLRALDEGRVAHAYVAQDADLLLADGLFPTAMWQEGLPHLSAAQTAELARDARVKKLVITHLNPNIDPETLLKQARAIRTDAELAHIGATYCV